MAIEWSELPLVLAISRAGSLTAAARTMRIDHSTAFRQLRLLEERLGTPLFDRLPGGTYVATKSGEALTRVAERMSEEIDTLNRRLLGSDGRLEGALRLTTSESIAHALLLPHLRAFQDRHPLIDIELDVSNRQLDLARREADVAIRTVRPARGALWGRKVATLAWGLYGRKPKRRAQASTSSAPRLIGWDSQSSSMSAARWIEKEAARERISFRTSSLLQQLEAARNGFGLAVLPCYLGDSNSELVRAQADPIAALQDELWIIAHEQLRKTARVRAFLEFIGPALRQDLALIEGRRPRH